MKAVSTGNTFQIYSNDLKTYETLPAQCYSVRFDKHTGFFLEKHTDIEIKESKIYGVHENKVEKVLRSFKMFHRNLGVILSGDKGIGKSLFAKLLSVRAIESGIPLILVDRYVPGVEAFIESIDQEVMVLFDEFDKTFADVRASDNSADAQAELLSLFDGMAQGKKLFVITCNELYKLNDYLVNRPGRFHYHFRFEYPSVPEIQEYLQDKLNKQYWKEIEKVIAFSRRIPLNYDCLRAIEFELNNGDSFDEAIKDLNILNISKEVYRITVSFENGLSGTVREASLDLFDPESHAHVWIPCQYKSLDGFYIDFDTIHCAFDSVSGQTIVPAEKVNLTFDEYDEEDKQNAEHIRTMKMNDLVILRKPTKALHYSV